MCLPEECNCASATLAVRAWARQCRKPSLKQGYIMQPPSSSPNWAKHLWTTQKLQLLECWYVWWWLSRGFWLSPIMGSSLAQQARISLLISSHSVCHRQVANVFSIPVFPILSCGATLTSAFSCLCFWFLFLEMTNIGYLYSVILPDLLNPVFRIFWLGTLHYVHLKTNRERLLTILLCFLHNLSLLFSLLLPHITV